MSGFEDSSEKSHEPTQKKLDDARKKGDIARTADLQTAASYLGLLLCMTVSGSQILAELAEVLLQILRQINVISGPTNSELTTMNMSGVMVKTTFLAASVVLVPAGFVLLTLLATRGLTFSTDKLHPKLSRVSLIENAKNKFGMRGIFEFLKSATKLIVFSVCLAVFFKEKMPVMVAAVELDPKIAVSQMLALSLQFLFVAFLVSIVIGAIDGVFQKFNHIRRHRMSHKDLRDEQKEAEGDPHFKQQRRARGQEIALNQMLADVAQSSVVIVNPTHYSVALRWEADQMGAPICTAKGIDIIALRIRETARENNVPIHSDAPTARALFASVEIGQEIDREFFQAVAASIRFADLVRGRVAPRGRSS